MADFLNVPKLPTLGLGCWAIGGPFSGFGRALGWGETDDAQSLRAIDAALDLGVRHFDTAQAYGAGHSEALLGRALKNHPDAAIATKVGLAIDPSGRLLLGPQEAVSEIRAALEGSFQRLGRGRIDLVLLHLNDLPISDAEPIFEMLFELHGEGRIGALGWSTDFPDRAEAFAGRAGFTCAEFAMNVFFRAEGMVGAVEGAGLLGLIRSPLAMGVLGGRYDANTRFAADDVRSGDEAWKTYFEDGRITPAHLAQLAAVREILTSGGRSLAQGALAWIWGRSRAAVPIPGFRTEAQVTDLAGALDAGPLSSAQMDEVEALLERPAEGPPRPR